MKILKGEKHFTSSVWLITKTKPRKVLLIHHKKFNLWIQPGGHIEKFENPIEAAVRETFEETGIDISFLINKIKKYTLSSFLPKPKFVLEERILKYKNEEEHFHIDLMYVVKINSESYKKNLKETNDIGFFTKEEALNLDIHDDSKIIINKILK